MSYRTFQPTGRLPRCTDLVTVPGPDGKGQRQLTITAYITERMETTGLRAELHAATVGLTRPTITDWLTNGARALQARQAGEHLDPRERAYADFAWQTQAAHARWVAAQMQLHHDIAAGGLLEGKIIEKVDPTRLDPDTGQPLVLERRVEQKRLLPDVKALEWELERLAREEGFAQRLELTGAEGAPLEDETRASRAARLAAEAELFLAGSAAGREAAEQLRAEAGDGEQLDA